LVTVSRVVFIADSFTRYQRNAIGFKDLPIELWEVKLFENDLVSYSQLKLPIAQGSIKTLTKDKTIQKVSKELIYPLSHHLGRIKSLKIRELFGKFSEEVQNLGKAEESSRKHSVGYWKDNIKFLEVFLFQNHLMLRIRIRGYKLDDPKRLAEELHIKDEYWKKIYKKIYLQSPDQIPDIMYLIKQAYEKAE